MTELLWGGVSALATATWVVLTGWGVWAFLLPFLLGTFTPKSAKNAKVRINSATYTAKSWTVTEKAVELDTTNAEGGGYEESIGGTTVCEVSVEADIDSTANPYDTPPTIRTGTRLAEVKLYLNDTTGPFWYFPYLTVFESTNPGNVKEALKISFRAKSYGTFTRPTGSI